MDEVVLSYLEAVYKKFRLLRQSEKGEIWLATDRAGQLVILKRLTCTGLPLKELQEVKCPLCPEIIYYSEDGRETIIVEEYIEGKSLDQFAAYEKMTEREATDLLITVAQGLAVMHKNGIIHRDIKPANLLRERSGRIRLIDFDASRIIKEGIDEDTTHLGTKGYAPPEQFGYGQTDGRSDIYALGVTVRRLLPENYQGYLRPIIRKCTAIDPDKRYQSAYELEKAVRRSILFHRMKRPMLVACVLASALLLNLVFLRVHETVPKQADEIAAEAVKSEFHVPSSTENAETKADTSQELPTADSSIPVADLPSQSSFTYTPTAEAPASPVNEQSVVPTSPSKTGTVTPGKEAPFLQPIAETPIISQGILRTTLYWNGSAIDSEAYPVHEISPDQWLSGSAFLHVENDSNTALPNSTISLAYSNNYGKKLHSETSLPALAPGETADIPIPCGTAFPEGAKGLSIWVQIRLPKTILPQTENYRCLRLDIAQAK